MLHVFENKGLRKTAFRQKVLNIFYENEHAITVSQIEQGLGKHDRITLYRTIKAFLDHGVIHEIVMPGDIKKLALCHDCNPKHAHDHHHAHQHNHIHFHCEECHEVLCVENEIPELQLKGFAIASIEVQAHGVCPSCSK